MSLQVSEHDEFLLSQLLDGELTAEQAADLHVRLRQEPALARAFEGLRRVDDLVKARRAVQPAVDYDRFHERFMARLATENTAVSEEDELLLNRLIDSELTPEDEALVLRRLAHEPALRVVYESLVRVNAALVQRRADVLAVDYGQFHRQVMNQVRQEAGRTARVVRFPTWARLAAPLAAAAAIALSVWLHPGWRQSSEPVNIAIAEKRDQSVGPALAELPPAEPQPVAMVRTNAPVARPAGVIEVTVGKPAADDDGLAAMHVTVTVSDELAEEVRKVDDERARQPSRKVFFAAATPADTSAVALTGDLF